MCGFIGKISKFKNEEGLLRGLPWLRRRGPDSQRLWSSRDSQVSILHARLAIVDKDSRADQPFSNPDIGVTISFVGEIYNYSEIRSQLSQYRFLTNSDTEVILAAYAAYGINGLSLLKGMFSVVIVDENKKKVILARDPIGKKPFFIARWGEDVLFGTSLLSLAAAHKGAVELNKDALGYFWENGHVQPNIAVLSGVKPILPGEIFEIDWSGDVLNKTGCGPAPLRLYNNEPLEEVIENVHSLLKLAISRRLLNNPKPTALLSGGIDSTVVCRIAKEVLEETNTKQPLQVLTLSSLIPLTNDEFYARYAAYRLKTPIRFIKPALNIKQLGSQAVNAIDLQDEPLGMPSFFLLERLVGAVSNYGKIVLSGDGGDEVFLGYGKPADWYDKGVINEMAESVISCGPKIPAWMSSWGRKAVTDTLIGHMLAKADRASAEQGVELRCPLLDWDLVCYMRSLPLDIILHSGKTKPLLKDQLKGWPRWFIERPKIGFAYNLRWLWGLSNYSALRDAIDPRAIAAFEHFLPSVLKQDPLCWKCTHIFQNFEAAWKLLAWSRFLARLDSSRGIGS